MDTLDVAIVGRDPEIRMQAAKAFDAAPTTWKVRLHTDPTHADVVVSCPDVPIEGAIEFDPNRPAAVFDEVARAARRNQRRVLVVTSPRGGTGVTSVALHLAREASSKYPTCYVDVDGRSGVGIRLNLGPEALKWDPQTEDKEKLRRAAHPVPGGFRVLASDSDDFDISVAVAHIASEWPCVIIDAPPSRSHEALRCRATAVLVVSPSIPAAHHARRFLEAHPDIDWAIVTNRLGPGGEATRRDLERILERPIGVQLPVAPALRDVEDDGVLVSTPWNRWRFGIVRLARALNLK